MMQRQEGNVLFLILIAVALFAALSYAVTQSSRGGGNADEETQAIEIAEILQFVSGARTTVQRMILNGTDISDIVLCNGGLDFCGLGNGFNDFCTTGTDCIFAPEGGGLAHPRVFDSGIIYLQTPANAYIVDGVGTAAADMVMLFEGLVGGASLSEDECVAFNKALGISTTLLKEATSNGVTADGLALSGQWDFCYDTSTTANPVYQGIHVIYAQ